MADVIFAGTPSRPALGMAEVKLVIDNSAGKIAVPMSEIEVSRTIFRSGESEYRVNGQVVRLLDVQELLSETGIGRALHTVVGQGQLEEVLLGPSGGAPEVHRGGRGHREASPPQGARRAQALGARPGSPAPAGRAGGAPPTAEAAPAAGRDGQEARDAHRAGRGALAASSRRLGCGRCCASGSVARTDGTEGLEARKAARELLDSLDGQVLQAADARAAAARSARRRRAGVPSTPRRRAPTPTRRSGPAVERESAARENLCRRGVANRAAGRRRRELARAEQELARVITELDAGERELDRAEQEFRAAEEHRREIEDVRRRMGEEAAGRRAEMEALRRSFSSSERERERLDGRPARRGRCASRALEHEREGLEADIERVDGQTSPLADRRTQLEQERRGSIEKIEELEDVERRHQARIDLLEARRRDIEETAGSRFLGHSHRARDRPAP